GEALAARLHSKVVFVEQGGELDDVSMRREKGRYDVGTGEVVVVLGNCVDAADVEATVFHELIGHKGLRELVGEREFDDFIRDLYENAGAQVRESIHRLMLGNGYDVGLATEEYIAGLAERGFDGMNGNERGLWGRVRGVVRGLLRKLFGGKVPEWCRVDDADIRYMLWRAYRGKVDGTLVGAAEDVQMRERLGIGGFRYRNGTDFVDRNPVAARALYEARIGRSMYRLTEAYQDSMLGLKEFYRAVETASGRNRSIEEVASFENAYTSENALTSINKAEADAWGRVVFKPLVDIVSQLSRNEEGYVKLLDYMMAKHGLERNAYMRAKARAKKRSGNRDFAGLTALTGEQDWRAAEAAAEAMVAEYEGAHDRRSIDDLWQRVNDATKASLTKVYSVLFHFLSSILLRIKKRATKTQHKSNIYLAYACTKGIK
ncbi:MAG: hypothetical protein K2L28_03385, partial [Muribaculaceae bacterium]|nr:hypothetical protein [Muribaculaceae bacterium]